MGQLIPVTRKTLPEQIAAQLVSMIEKGVWQEGERLPSELELCKGLRVGRPSLREAIKSMVLNGNVVVRPGKGIFVVAERSSFSRRVLAQGAMTRAPGMADLVEARAILEPQLAAFCAQRATDKDLEELGSLVEEMQQTLSERDRFVDCDLRFHVSIAVASQNHALAEYMKAVAAPLRKLISSGSKTIEIRRLVHSQHVHILRALEQHQASEARTLMRTHLRTLERGYRLLQRPQRDKDTHLGTRGDAHAIH